MDIYLTDWDRQQLRDLADKARDRESPFQEEQAASGAAEDLLRYLCGDVKATTTLTEIFGELP